MSAPLAAVLNTALVIALVGLTIALARACHETGKRRGWRECMAMVTEEAHAQVQRQVEEQRRVVARMREVDAAEAKAEALAASKARWN